MTHSENGSPTVKTDGPEEAPEGLPERASISREASRVDMGLVSAIVAIAFGVVLFFVALFYVPVCNGGYSTMWFGVAWRSWDWRRPRSRAPGSLPVS